MSALLVMISSNSAVPPPQSIFVHVVLAVYISSVGVHLLAKKAS